LKYVKQNSLSQIRYFTTELKKKKLLAMEHIKERSFKRRSKWVRVVPKLKKNLTSKRCGIAASLNATSDDL